MKELKRCFIALELPRTAINEIRVLQKMIKDKFIFTGKFTEPENLHLTLKFLGELEDSKVDEIIKILKEVKFESFFCELGGVGVFNKRNPRIVWVKLKGAERIQKEIDFKLKDSIPEEERFMGHITIARIKHIKEKEKFVDYLRCLKGKSRFEIDRFYLKKSELFPEGPVYEDIKGFKLI